MHKTRLQSIEFSTGTRQLLDTNKECEAFPSAQSTDKHNRKPVNRCHDMNPTVCRHNLQYKLSTRVELYGVWFT